MRHGPPKLHAKQAFAQLNDLAYFDFALGMAIGLAFAHWPRITRIAEALIERGMLEGDDVAQLCG